MDELIKLVVAKTGISESHARLAVETVLTFVKGKLPAPIASQIDGLLKGGSAGGGLDIGSIGGALGGLFDKK
jgi:hypothetical protein